MKGGSAALAAMIRKKKEVLYGSEGSDNLEGQSTTTMADNSFQSPEAKPIKYQPTTTAFSGAAKCCMCEKTVYKTEEMIAVGRTWHTGCFTCGGAAHDGCGRTLRRDGYSDHNNQPYCSACSSKLFKPKGYGHGTALHLDSGVPAAPSSDSPSSTRVPPPPVVPKSPEPTAAKEVVSPAPEPVAAATPTKPLPAPILKDIKLAVAAKEETKPVKYTPKVVNMAFNSTPKCTICAKSVYKMEEMVAVGRVWHLNCFTCGGSSSEGCKRVLKRDGYVDHENNPFCIACHSKLYRPKGFGYGNTLNTDYGPAPDAEGHVTDGVANLSTTDAPAPVTGSPSFTSKAGAISSPQASSKPAPPAGSPSDSAHSVPAPPSAPPAPPVAPAAAPVASPSAEKKVAAPKPPARRSFTGESTDSAAVPHSTIAIGGSSRSAGGVFKEAAYVGDNDEVDENEWD